MNKKSPFLKKGSIFIIEMSKMNFEKMQILLASFNNGFHPLVKFCVTTIGVCVFRASSSVGAFFVFRRKKVYISDKIKPVYMFDDKSVHQRIREERKRMKISQKVFAEKIGVPLKTYSGIERGETEIKAQLLLDIAYHLDVDAEYLLHGTAWEKDNPLNKRSRRTPLNVTDLTEKKLIFTFRRLNDTDRNVFLHILDAIEFRAKNR